MCVSPTVIYLEGVEGPKVQQVACKWCWSCQKNRLNDLVGRCLLEQSESDWSIALTLTYDDNKLTHPSQTKVIHKNDAQDFLKRLRRSFKVRYLVAGEYGSKKGRVHFHLVLFGKGNPPAWPSGMCNLPGKLWPFGHVFVDREVDEKSIRYIAKYLLKGAKRKKTRFDNRYNKEWVSYSTRPIMGEAFIRRLGATYACEALFPHNFQYVPPNSNFRRTYTLTGEGKMILLDTIFDLNPNLRIPERMQTAVLAWRKDRQRKGWDRLSAAEREKYLDAEINRAYRPDERYMRLAAKFLADRMKVEGYGSDKIAEFKKAFPDDYAIARNAYKRDLALRPPTPSESGGSFPF
jgi:hypothetical protein